jgi:hypothetical protein
LTEAQKLYINLEKEYDVITDGIKRAMWINETIV